MIKVYGVMFRSSFYHEMNAKGFSFAVMHFSTVFEMNFRYNISFMMDEHTSGQVNLACLGLHFLYLFFVAVLSLIYGDMMPKQNIYRSMI